MINGSENIEITNIASLADKIQVGNIIQIVDDTNPDKRIIHNMVVVPMANGKLAAIEELMSDDKITTGDFTYCNYTELDFDKYIRLALSQSLVQRLRKFTEDSVFTHQIFFTQ